MDFRDEHCCFKIKRTRKKWQNGEQTVAIGSRLWACEWNRSWKRTGTDGRSEGRGMEKTRRIVEFGTLQSFSVGNAVF